jgi:hypothetical protein
MRETVSLASSYRRRELPTSLVQRLEMVQHSALASSGQVRLRQTPSRGVRRGAHVIVLAWFSLGVIASGAMGAGAIVGLRTFAAGAPLLAGAPAVAAWSHPRADWDAVHVAIDRSQRSRATLSLQVTGAENGDFQVVMHGLPAGARPSRGAPIGESTWVLKPTDLDGLYLTLDDAVPDTFDVRIAVLTSPGIVTTGSVVEFRLVEMSPSTQAAVMLGTPAPSSPPAYPGMFDAPMAYETRSGTASTPVLARTATARHGDKAGGQPAHRRAGPVVASASRPSGQAASTSATWPDGAYRLGATPREPEGATSWWQMPPPNWSPFQVGQERP